MYSSKSNENNKQLLIAAVILAAGKGQRAGQPKWQLCYQGQTFLEIILAKLEECQCVAINCVATVETSAQILDLINTAQISRLPQFSVSINPNPMDGMLSSIYYGLQDLPNYDGYLIFPVDHPFVKSKTIHLLVNAFAENFVKNKDENIFVMPRCKEKCGHPIIVSRAISKILKPIFFNWRFDDFLRQQNFQRREVVVDDIGILRNINYLQDIEGVGF